ncbi:CTSB [Cordylochernes scorpioides]|uniref:CTSB n=1 Tax=Cordylochernes scorpioides TaxID=51811 RepID=A0ABY6LA48_9ARAC|nr:CTSB [Cordylochernes scorpioides]
MAHPTAEPAVRWTPTVHVPYSIPWAELRRNCFSGHDADVALRLALHALLHPDHPASRRSICAACRSSDGSLAHRYWSCRAVRPLLREVFASCEVPLDLQVWLFGVDPHPEAMKLTSVAKATILVLRWVTPATSSTCPLCGKELSQSTGGGVFPAVVVLLLLAAVGLAFPTGPEEHLWEAADYDIDFEQRTCSSSGLGHQHGDMQLLEHDPDIQLPREFDARKHWPECESIGHVWDQALCGSCWAWWARDDGAVQAMASAAVITDRTCIASGGKFHQPLSPDDLTTCCKKCGGGCNGGSPALSLLYWINEGLVTGGDYGSHSGCRSYEIVPLGEGSPALLTPTCKKHCDTGYNKTYEEDLHYGKRAYRIRPNDELQMRLEMLKNGPLIVGMEVTSQLQRYKSATTSKCHSLKLHLGCTVPPLSNLDYIYNKRCGRDVKFVCEGIFHHRGPKRILGWHAVKLIGWGEENGVPYWLGVNSWGTTHWGEKESDPHQHLCELPQPTLNVCSAGLFRIKRGYNELEIENFVFAGLSEDRKYLNADVTRCLNELFSQVQFLPNSSHPH